MPASTGINRDTGKPLSDLEHVRQSFMVIFTTRISERMMRRTFGSKVPQLLGQNLVASTLTKFFMAIVTAVDLWEPRLRIIQVLYPVPQNVAKTLRLGDLTIAIIADYRPHALAGDTVTDAQRIYL